MPSGQADYDPVSDDGYESKTCFGEEDFKSGIDFAAKVRKWPKNDSGESIPRFLIRKHRQRFLTGNG